jgi:predicted RNA-binding protein YlxR (DUF448 family)
MAPGRKRSLPRRTCVQCGAKGDKDRFLRIAGRPGEGWEPDPRGGKAGRGIYLCRGADCIEAFSRRIRTPKGAQRFRMGSCAASLAERLEAWRSGS